MSRLNVGKKCMLAWEHLVWPANAAHVAYVNDTSLQNIIIILKKIFHQTFSEIENSKIHKIFKIITSPPKFWNC